MTIGTERTPQSSDDISARDIKVDTKKKVSVKKKAGKVYGKIEIRLVSDPIGETNCAPFDATMQY